MESTYVYTSFGVFAPDDVYTYVDSIHAYTDKSFVKKYAEELLGEV